MSENEQDIELEWREQSFLDDICDKCGSTAVWETCWSCGGEGGTDGEELMMEDPFWYGPDDFRKCDICNGKGGFEICTNDKCK